MTSRMRHRLEGALVLSFVIAITLLIAFGAEGPPEMGRPIDWNTVLLALIAGMPAVIAAITGLIVVIRKQNDMHIQMNSRLDQLVLASKQVSFAEGVAKGIMDAGGKK